jgi:hypothetical protein
MFGYRNWNELLAHIDPDDYSLPDGYAQDELYQRATQYLQAVQRLGFSIDEAWVLITEATAGPWLGLGRFLNRSTYQASTGPEATAANG